MKTPRPPADEIRGPCGSLTPSRPSALSVNGAASMRIESFAPIAGSDALILILGSMPGVASLQAQEYYAHPYNQFWRIMGELYGAVPTLPYAQRLNVLVRKQLALWDVLQSCVRVGSLDTAIAQALPNDLPGFLRQHPRIARVCCNGGHAASAYRRHFGTQLQHEFPRLDLRRLPSTSPANARWSYARKLSAWREALSHV